MKKKLLIVEPGFQDFKEPIVQMLLESGDVELYFAIGLGEKVPSSWIAPYSSGSFTFSYVDNDLVKAARDLEADKQIRFSGALTYIETSVHFVNRLQHEMGWPIVSSLTGKEIRSKAEMRKLFKAGGVSQPEFQIIKPDERIPNLKFPIVVKPAEMMASLAVQKVSAPSELLGAIASASTADFHGEDLRELYGDISNDVLLEEFICGPEYSVESLVANGVTKILGITKKETTAEFDEVGHTFPCTELSEKTTSQVYELVFLVHNILKLQNTATHLEFKIRNDQPVLIEINCRQTGGLITELMRLSTYPALGQMTAATALGELLVDRARVAPSQSIRFITSPVGGRLKAISMVQSSLQTKIFYKPGAQLHVPAGGGLLRLGYTLGAPELVQNCVPAVQVAEPIYFESEIFKVQEASLERLKTLAMIEAAAWGAAQAASIETLKARLQSSRGCSIEIVDQAEGRIIGFCTALYAGASMDLHQSSWLDHALALENEALDKPQYDSLFIVSISILPEAANGAGAALLKGLERFALLKGLRSISYGARMTAVTRLKNSSKDALDTYSEIQRGEIKEPSVQIGLKVGYRIESLLKNYFADPESLDFGILMTKRFE